MSTYKKFYLAVLVLLIQMLILYSCAEGQKSSGNTSDISVSNSISDLSEQSTNAESINSEVSSESVESDESDVTSYDESTSEVSDVSEASADESETTLEVAPDNYRLYSVETNGYVSVYEYNEQGQLTAVKMYRSQELQLIEEYTYDENGYKNSITINGGVRKETWENSQTGKPLSGVKLNDTYDGDYEYTYTYDESDRVLTYVKKSLDGELLEKNEYEYIDFEDGSYKEIYRSSNSSYTETKYDKDGIIAEKKYFEDDGSLKSLYEYDEHGNLVRKEHNSGNVETYEFEYDGSLILGFKQYENGTLLYEEERLYDKYGNLTQVIGKDANNIILQITTFTYKYFD